jgi:hypothetical protein
MCFFNLLVARFLARLFFLFFLFSGENSLYFSIGFLVGSEKMVRNSLQKLLSYLVKFG